MAQTAIADILEYLLEQAAYALDITEGAEPAPAHQVIPHGMVTVDCPDMLAVYWMRLAPKPQPNQRLQKCVIVPAVQFTIRLQRCWPTPSDNGTPPSAATITAAELQIVTDGQAIWKHLTRTVVDNDFPVSNACDAVAFSHMEPKPASGGSAGLDIVLTVTL